MLFVWIALLLLGAVFVLVFGLWMVGRGIDPAHHAATSARFKGSPRAVWAALEDVSGWTAWMPGLTAVERLPDRDGRPCWNLKTGSQEMTIVIDSLQAPRRLVTRIDDPRLNFGGTWTWEVAPGGAADTLVTLAEEGTIRAPLFRAIAKHVLGYDATQRAHLLGLAGKFSSEKPVLQRAR